MSRRETGQGPDLRTATAAGFQVVNNQERAIVYLNQQQFYLRLYGVLFLLFLLGFLGLVAYSVYQSTLQMYASLLSTLKRGNWTACDPMSVALSIRYKWYNDVFGCGSLQNKELPFALAMAVYNPELNRIVNQNLPQALQSIAHASTLLDGSADQNTARNIVCKGLGCFCPDVDQAGCDRSGCSSDSDPLAQICLKPCQLPPSVGSSTAMAALQGGFGGATGGMGFLFLHQMIGERGAAAGLEGVGSFTGPLGIGLAVASTAVGAFAAAAHNSIEKQNAQNSCRNQHQGCYLPPGVDCSNVD